MHSLAGFLKIRGHTKATQEKAGCVGDTIAPEREWKCFSTRQIVFRDSTYSDAYAVAYAFAYPDA